MVLLQMICVGCGCTDDRACEGGCAWIETRPPLCSTCAATKFPTGTRIEVKAGRFRGRVGIVKGVPKLEPMLGWRFVDLKAGPRSKARRNEFILLADLSEGRS